MLFSSGGMVAALMIPVLLFLFGIAFPLDCCRRRTTRTCSPYCGIR